MDSFQYDLAAGASIKFPTGTCTRAVMYNASARVKATFHGKKNKTIPMEAGGSYGDADDELVYKYVTVKNENDAPITFELLCGDEYFSRNVTQIVGSIPVPSIYTPSVMQMLTSATHTLVAGNEYKNQIIIPANPLRKKLHVRTADVGATIGSPMNANQSLCFGYAQYDVVTGYPSTAPFSSGWPVYMGEGRSVENSGEIQLSAVYPITGGMMMAVFIDEEF